MKVEMMIIETDMRGDSFTTILNLIGPPAGISHEIACHVGDLQSLIVQKKLLTFTVLTADYEKGKVHGS